MSDSQNKPDQISEALKDVNKKLRNRTFFVFLVMFIATVMVSYRMDLDRGKNDDLNTSIAFLEEMLDAPNLSEFIEQNETAFMTLYMINHHALSYELEKTGYQDRTPVVQQLNKLWELRKLEADQEDIFEQSASLQGISIPFVSLAFIAPLVIMILFHDTVWIIEHRRKLLSEAKKSGMADWQKGSGLLGYKPDAKESFVFYISRPLDFFMVAVALVLPLLTALLCVKFASYFTENLVLLYCLLGCVVVIGLDTLIILYRMVKRVKA